MHCNAVSHTTSSWQHSQCVAAICRSRKVVFSLLKRVTLDEKPLDNYSKALLVSNEVIHGETALSVDDSNTVGLVCESSSVDLRRVIGNDLLTDSCPASIIGALPGQPACLLSWLSQSGRVAPLTGDICQAIQLLCALPRGYVPSEIPLRKPRVRTANVGEIQQKH